MNAMTSRYDLTLAYRLSPLVAFLMAVASVAGLALGLTNGLYGPDPTRALGDTGAGLLLPGFLGQDLFNLLVGVPVLLVSMCLARRGSLTCLLLWPGALLYALYRYVICLTSVPFSALFLLYLPLVTLSAYAIIDLVVSIDGEQAQPSSTASCCSRSSFAEREPRPGSKRRETSVEFRTLRSIDRSRVQRIVRGTGERQRLETAVPRSPGNISTVSLLKASIASTERNGGRNDELPEGSPTHVTLNPRLARQVG